MVGGGREADEDGAELAGDEGVEGEIEEKGCLPIDFQLYLKHARF